MISAVKAVRDHSQAKGVRKAILFTLASYANKDGTNAFISQVKIAESVGASRKTVNETFREAQEREEIELTGRKGRGQGIYSFKPWIDNLSPQDTGGRNDLSPHDSRPEFSAHRHMSSGNTPPESPGRTYIPGNEQVTDQAPQQDNPKFEWLLRNHELEAEGKPGLSIREFMKEMSSKCAV